MRESYWQHALDGLLAGVRTRRGWDFSGMNELRQPAPWDYHDVVLRYLRSSDVVLDVGTGAGERLRDLAPSFGHGLGIDADPEMVRLAREDPAAGNLSFRVCSERLESVPGTFDVILDRHAPFDLSAIAAHLRPGGYFITQQVGERNMACVKAALGQPPGPPPIQRQAIAEAACDCWPSWSTTSSTWYVTSSRWSSGSTPSTRLTRTWTGRPPWPAPRS